MFSTLAFLALSACHPGVATPDDRDGDGFRTLDGDCNDLDATVHPGAIERCDAAQVDEDCDGLVDDADPSVDPTTRVATWPDADGDGFGRDELPLEACDATVGRSIAAGDCDDTRTDVSPGATEVCDAASIDEDCDGLANDLDDSTLGRSVFYPDLDGDSYGDPAAGTASCIPVPGHVLDGSDCDDSRNDVHPGALEVCDPNDVDEDCDGLSDDADSAPTGTLTVYADADLDGLGNAAIAWAACDVGVGESADGTDCNDADPTVQAPVLVYVDADADGYGAADGATPTCTPAPDAIRTGDDCDDTRADVSPGAVERCDPDDTDEDCSGAAEDAPVDPIAFHLDLDEDGYGDPDTELLLCDPAEGWVAASDDCNDGDATIHPHADEILCDGIAQDCYGRDGDILVPEDDMDLRAAVDIATQGDVICVGPGDWVAPTITTDHLTILSTQGSEFTTLTPFMLPLAVLTLENVEDLELRGFTLAAVDAWQGAGLNIRSSEDIVLGDVVIQGAVATGEGGAIYSADSNGLVFEDFVLEDNAAESGAGIYLDGGVNITVRNLTATANAATLLGGAVTAVGTVDLIVEGGTFTGNTAPVGGAFLLDEVDGATLTDLTVTDGWSLIGGAVAAFNTQDLQVTDATMHGNAADDLGGAISLSGTDRTTILGGSYRYGASTEGGAICAVLDDSTTIQAAEFADNEAITNGGHIAMVFSDGSVIDGITATGGQAERGGALAFEAASATTVVGGTFTSNEADIGGALSFLATNGATIEGATVRSNQARLGGGFAIGLSNDVFMVEVVTESNHADEDGGGLYATYDLDLSVQDAVWSANDAGSGGGAMHLDSCLGTALVNLEVEANMASVLGGGLECYLGDLTEIDVMWTANGPDQVACNACGGCVAR